MSIQVYDTLAKARGRGVTVALVTVNKVPGALDLPTGAQIVVENDRIIAGTLGDGRLDQAGTELGISALADGHVKNAQFAVDARIAPSNSDPSPLVHITAELHHPEPAALVLGADSVCLATANCAQSSGLRGVVVSPGGATDVAPGVEVKADHPAGYLLNVPPGAQDAVLIGDASAGWAQEATRIALASSAFYVGVVAQSHDAAAQALRQFTDAGVPKGSLQRLRVPAGLDVGAESPEEHAVAIVAEMLAVERGRSGDSRKLRWLV